MTAEVDIANMALSALGTRSSIAALNENSPEARASALWIDKVRDEVIRLAPWVSVRNFINLSLICAAPGTPENPVQGEFTWQKGIPAPPWFYEYAYPSDCLKALYIVPQFTTGFAGGVPITTAITGGAPNFWNGPPVRYAVGLDQIDPNTGLPSNNGIDTKVIWTNQEQAILCYNKQITNPDLMDAQLQYAWVAALAGRMVYQLNGDKQQANMKLKEANDAIITARVADGNEGLTVNDVTPDWIRQRGIEYANDYGWTPNQMIDWGNLLSMY